MVKYGLCGKTLRHSYSAIIHGLLGNNEYSLINMTEQEFCEFMKKREFSAVNVTIPYKTDALKCCDEVSDEALKIGSVNTVINKDGRLYGYNTDYFGFKYMLDGAGIDVSDKKVLIFGTGGTSLTARRVVADCGAKETVIVSRSGEVNYENVYSHYDADILINTTPVGMFPDNGKSLIDVSRFYSLSGVADVIYNPLRTRLISDAAKAGIPAVSGLSMLTAQAVKAHELFFSMRFDNMDETIEKILAECTSSVCNIILVGMPGCGKTTVGNILSSLTGKPLYDSDTEIEKSTGRTPAEIIKADGEPAFRHIETQVLDDLTKMSGCIIATGGGAVLSEENRILMKQNGICVYIKRETENLATSGRPLSEGGKERLYRLFEQRNPIYSALADFDVSIEENPEKCAGEILSRFSSKDILNGLTVMKSKKG